MARIRSIKPEFWSSEQVMECSTTARLLFIGLWNFCDDAGNHSASVKTIKAEVFPGDEIELSTVRQLLDELSSNGLIVFYSSENKNLLHVTGCHHQKIDKPTYKHPPYIPEKSETTRRTLADRSPPERKGEERRGEEPKGGESEGNQSTTDLLGDGTSSADEGKPDEVDIVRDAFNRLLPDCQAVAVIGDKRRRAILAACKLARKVCKQQGWRYVPAEFWEAYWAECAADEWRSGRKPNPNNPTWKQSIDVLLREDQFAKVMDQAISAMRREAA